MKTLAWQQFFAEQRKQHGKEIFSVAELANAAQTPLHTLNTELHRLVKRGIVTRYAQGRYGPPQGVEPDAVIASIDTHAYITGFYALFLHHLVTQVPTEITCFTNRRHNRRDNRDTPAGRIKFICVPAQIYRKPNDQQPASAERALCDFIWLMHRTGVEPKSLVTFTNLKNLKEKRLRIHLRDYPEPIKQAVTRLLHAPLAPRRGQESQQDYRHR